MKFVKKLLTRLILSSMEDLKSPFIPQTSSGEEVQTKSSGISNLSDEEYLLSKVEERTRIHNEVENLHEGILVLTKLYAATGNIKYRNAGARWFSVMQKDILENRPKN